MLPNHLLQNLQSIVFLLNFCVKTRNKTLISSYISFNDDFTKKLFFIDDCNSISELKLEKKEIELVKIYPNPAHNELNVELSGDDNFYEILSLDGKILKSDLLVNNKINVSNLENGIYLLNLDNSNVIRFVKN